MEVKLGERRKKNGRGRKMEKRKSGMPLFLFLSLHHVKTEDPTSHAYKVEPSLRKEGKKLIQFCVCFNFASAIPKTKLRKKDQVGYRNELAG